MSEEKEKKEPEKYDPILAMISFKNQLCFHGQKLRTA